MSQKIGLDLDDARDLGVEREDIAAAIGVTVDRLNKWTAPSKPHLPPPQFLPGLARATGGYRLLDWVCGEAGGFFGRPEDRADLELGRAVRQLDVLQQRVAEALAAPGDRRAA